MSLTTETDAIRSQISCVIVIVRVLEGYFYQPLIRLDRLLIVIKAVVMVEMSSKVAQFLKQADTSLWRDPKLHLLCLMTLL